MVKYNGGLVPTWLDGRLCRTRVARGVVQLPLPGSTSMPNPNSSRTIIIIVLRPIMHLLEHGSEQLLTVLHPLHPVYTRLIK